MMRELTVRLIIGALFFAWSSVSYGSESSQIAEAHKHVEAAISTGQREHADIETIALEGAVIYLKMAYNEDRPGGCPEGPPCKNKDRVTYKPAEAIDMVTAKIQAAIDGISKGASGDEAAALIKQASDASKEINANDKLDNARAKANRKLKAAMAHAKESAIQESEQELKDAKKDFEALKSLL